MQFFYRAIDSQGKSQTGSIDAPDRRAAELTLRSWGWQVAHLQPLSSPKVAPVRPEPEMQIAPAGFQPPVPVPRMVFGLIALFLALLLASRGGRQPAAPDATAGYTNVTVTGVVPKEDVQVHLMFPDGPFEVQRASRDLGAAGQPFQLTVAVPTAAANSTMDVDFSQGARRWRVAGRLPAQARRVPAPAPAAAAAPRPIGDGRPFPAAAAAPLHRRRVLSVADRKAAYLRHRTHDNGHSKAKRDRRRRRQGRA